MQHGNNPRTCGRVDMGAVVRSQGQGSKNGAVKRSRENLTWGQAVKADFRGSRILTPVANGSMRVTTLGIHESWCLWNVVQ